MPASSSYALEVERVARQVARRVDHLLERRGHGEPDDDDLAADEPLLASLYAASVTSRIATGPQAGQRVARLGDRIDAGAICDRLLHNAHPLVIQGTSRRKGLLGKD